jgi:hypothetical protein
MKRPAFRHVRDDRVASGGSDRLNTLDSGRTVTLIRL